MIVSDTDNEILILMVDFAIAGVKEGMMKETVIAIEAGRTLTRVVVGDMIEVEGRIETEIEIKTEADEMMGEIVETDEGVIHENQNTTMHPKWHFQVIWMMDTSTDPRKRTRLLMKMLWLRSMGFLR